MKIERKSEHSETDAEDKHSLGLNLVEDTDDDFIFQNHHPQIHEPTIIEHIACPASEVPNNINQKNSVDNIPDKTRNLMLSGKVSVDGSLSDVKCGRQSHMQNQRLSGISRYFPRETNEEVKPKQKEKSKFQIQASLIEYLLQFIQKTALPAIQKYEHLMRNYCNEKK